MIAAVQFHNFKALRAAAVSLEAFNLFVGPNGSGKTSLIEAVLRLRTLAALPAAGDAPGVSLEQAREDGPRIEFAFKPPFDGIRVHLACVHESICDLLHVEFVPGSTTAGDWPALRRRLLSIRGYLFDHYAMAASEAPRDPNGGLASNGGNIAWVLGSWRRAGDPAFAAVETEFVRLMPEFSALDTAESGGGTAGVRFALADGTGWIGADNVSQGALYLLAVLVLAFTPDPPAVVCLEEADRGVHPRLLREVRDALYRLSYPADFGQLRQPVQVIATTHSPYLLDLFKNHPEEVVLANKRGTAATFERLSDRPDVSELLKEASLGDLWYTGILGGVPGTE